MNHGRTAEWSKLDNAAKIFPPTSSEKDPKVFRFSCELYDAVDPAVLQEALDRTMEQFPFYRSVLKKGLFWYYLEASDLIPLVVEEHEPPCRALYRGDWRTLLFEVTYYRRRINLEVYHALSDGTGALHFLRVLVYFYLTIKHADDFPEGLPTLDYDASVGQKTADSFLKYYAKENSRRGSKARPAFKQRGPQFPENRVGVIEGLLSAKQLLGKAREYGATLTEFLCAVLICSMHEIMTLRDERKPVTVTVPVNLRNYFPSETARNFFGVITVGYCFKGNSSAFEDVLSHIRGRFAEELTPEKLSGRMNKLASIEHNPTAKIVPLMIKNPGMRFANYLAEREVSMAISNIGRIRMPQEFVRYIRLFDVFIHTPRLQACVCSYGDNLMISFGSPFKNPDVQRCFFRMLSEMGLSVTVSTNLLDSPPAPEPKLPEAQPAAPRRREKSRRRREQKEADDETL